MDLPKKGIRMILRGGLRAGGDESSRIRCRGGRKIRVREVMWGETTAGIEGSLMDDIEIEYSGTILKYVKATLMAF